MYQFPIGVIMDSLCMDTKSAIEKAAEIGAKGMQMYATKGEHAPENMTAAKRRELMDMMEANGLVFSALCGDLGMGFGNKDKNPELIDKSKRIMELAKELGTNIVTTHIGVVPENPSHPRYQIMQEACYELSQYADSLDAHFAIETGPETSAVLKKFLDSLGSRGVAVNLDPANLVMVTGDDPVAAVHTLKDYIVHTHAKDGRNIWHRKPEFIYGVEIDHDNFASNEPSFEELPLGQGNVPFPEYLKALDEIGYKGFLTIEREVHDNPVGDITIAADFLKALLR